MRFNTPEELLEWMSNNIDYGFAGKNGEVLKFDEDEDYTQYRLQSPEQVEASKVAVCWDQAEFERKYFQEMGIKHQAVYIIREVKPYYPTHTFIVYENLGKLYWFENSYYAHRGIHGPFNSIEEIVKVVHQYMVDDDNDSVKDMDYEWAILPQPKYGSTCLEYMDFAEEYLK